VGPVGSKRRLLRGAAGSPKMQERIPPLEPERMRRQWEPSGSLGAMRKRPSRSGG
jgi:hypothetical protein